MSDEQDYEFSCPECGNDCEFDSWPYDFGRCSETGYSDSGVRCKCLKCGFEADEDGNFKRRKRVAV